MRTRPIGLSGIEASVIAVGTWAIGGDEWGGADRGESVDAIRAFLDAGATFIDTAPIYGKGLAEEVVGEAVTGRRDEVVLATKCGLRWDTTEGEFMFEAPRGNVVHRFLGREGIRIEVERSLRRLKTDRIDLYQTHWQDGTTPIAETMEALLELKAEGKIRAIGVSNVTPAQLDEYRGVGPIDSDQERFNMADREHHEGLIPHCRDNGLAFLAYSPLAMGLLTGKMGPERTFREGDVRGISPRFSVENRRKVQRLLDRLQGFADGHGATLAQYVMAWTAHVDGVTHVLCGARNPEQARENGKAGEIDISPEEKIAANAIVAEEDVDLPELFE